MSDNLGDRLLMFDNSGAPSLELLRFRPELAEAPGFEAALREQVQRLAAFQHPAFASVRSVERLEPDDDLALVSNHTPGKRLSEILHRGKGPALAAALIKQLAPAIAQFQQQNPGVYRGLLSPDRIVVSPEARMTIVEHVVAAAIGTLNLPESELASLGIAPPIAEGEEAGDWYQLGIVALSVLIGRPVTETDLPRLDALVDEAFAAAGPEAAPLSPFIREWLGRALQLQGGTDGTHAPRALEAPNESRSEVETKVESEKAAPEPVPPPVEPAPAPVEPPRRGSSRDVLPPRQFIPASADIEVTAPQAPPREMDAPGSLFDVRPADHYRHRPHPKPAPASSEGNLSPFEREVLAGRLTLNIENRPAVSDPVPARASRVRVRSSRRLSNSVVRVIIAIAAIETGILGWLAYARLFGPRPPVAVATSASGEHMLVTSGSGTPSSLNVAVAPDLGWVRVTTSRSEGILGKKAESGSATVRVASPIELKVLEGTRVLGSVPGRDIDLPAGSHSLELVNEALGYRAQQTVVVEPGQTIVIHVAPSPGWVTVDAPGAPEVSIDGQAVGRAPLGPLALTPGEHQVTFAHQGGRTERQRITIKSDQTTQVVGKGR